MAQQVEQHILKRYNLLKKIGSGAYGHVWKVTDRQNGKIYALKKIFDAFQHSTDAQRTFREIVLLHELNHPNIIKLYTVIRAANDKDLYLLFEYMEADLHNTINQKILKDAHNRFIIYQLVKSILYLHSAGIIHRDLKPSNLLLNSDCLMKICDFGLSRSLTLINHEQSILTEQVATRWYRAPQILLGSQVYNQSADIWSIGCILAELIIMKPIFPGSSTFNQLERIIAFTGKPNKTDIQSLNSNTAATMIESMNQIRTKPMQQWFKCNISSQAIELIKMMLSFNPNKRPTAKQILKHSYIAQFRNSKQEIQSSKMIYPPINDNTKLGLKQYRQLIYQRIRNIYHNSVDKQIEYMEKTNTVKRPVSSHQQQSCSSINSNYSKIEDNGSSHKNMVEPPSQYKKSTYLSTKYGSKFTHDEESNNKMKKKNSLKDMLKNSHKYSSNTNLLGQHEKFVYHHGHYQSHLGTSNGHQSGNHQQKNYRNWQKQNNNGSLHHGKIGAQHYIKSELNK